jgi:hypothetical protein
MIRPQVELLRSRDTTVQGPVPGAVAIAASVGQGGANRRDDTQGVQTALNAVPVVLGGAGNGLAVDGLVGPLTIGAITTFQSRWLTIQDGRCDPAGPTLALLNAMVGVGDALPSSPAAAAGDTRQSFFLAAKTSPSPKSPPPSAADLANFRVAQQRQTIVERHHLPVLLRSLLIALRVNDAAQRHVQRLKALAPGGTLTGKALGDGDRRAFLLVAKTFKLHERAPAVAETGLRQVDSILRQSMLLVSSRLPPRPPIVSPAPPVNAPLFVSLFGRPARFDPNTFGYTVRGGLHLAPGPRKGSVFKNEFVQPGKVEQERTERIYLVPHFDDASPDEQRLTLLHEMAHFVGPPAPGGIRDLETVHEAEDYKKLNSSQRLQNADSYAWFPTECTIGTNDAVRECRSKLDAIGQFPFVNRASFADPNPDIAIVLPPPDSAEGEPFRFPGGFT